MRPCGILRRRRGCRGDGRVGGGATGVALVETTGATRATRAAILETRRPMRSSGPCGYRYEGGAEEVPAVVPGVVRGTMPDVVRGGDLAAPARVSRPGSGAGGRRRATRSP